MEKARERRRQQHGRPLAAVPNGGLERCRRIFGHLQAHGDAESPKHAHIRSSCRQCAACACRALAYLLRRQSFVSDLPIWRQIAGSVFVQIRVLRPSLGKFCPPCVRRQRGVLGWMADGVEIVPEHFTKRCGGRSLLLEGYPQGCDQCFRPLRSAKTKHPHKDAGGTPCCWPIHHELMWIGTPSVSNGIQEMGRQSMRHLSSTTMHVTHSSFGSSATWNETMSGDDLDFLAIAALAGQDVRAPRSRARPAAPSTQEQRQSLAGVSSDADHRQLAPLHQGELVAANGDEDDEDIEWLAHVAAAGAERRKHLQRSWQHTQHARASKELKRARLQLAVAQEESSIAKLQVEAQAVALGERRTGSKTSGVVLPPGALAILKLSCVTGAGPRSIKTTSTARAAAQLTACILAAQSERMKALFLEGGDGVLGVLPAPMGRSRLSGGIVVHAFCLQWDETAQRLKSINRSAHKKSRSHIGPVSVQTMMLYATMHKCVTTAGGTRYNISEPMFMKALLLEEQRANHILEGIIRRAPLPFESPHDMRAYASKCDAFVVSWTVDRAGVNFVISRYLLRSIGEMPGQHHGALRTMRRPRLRAHQGASSSRGQARASLQLLVETPAYARLRGWHARRHDSDRRGGARGQADAAARALHPARRGVHVRSLRLRGPGVLEEGRQAWQFEGRPVVEGCQGSAVSDGLGELRVGALVLGCTRRRQASFLRRPRRTMLLLQRRVC